MTDKFIYVFNEKDKNTLLAHGYELIQEPKAKKTPKKKAKAKDEEFSMKAKGKDAETVEDTKDEVKYWVFLNKTARDMVLNRLEGYVFSDTLTL